METCERGWTSPSEVLDNFSFDLLGPRMKTIYHCVLLDGIYGKERELERERERQLDKIVHIHHQHKTGMTESSFLVQVAQNW